MEAYLIAISTLWSIQVLLTLGLYLQFGLAGLVNFGHVAGYALGAYAAAIVTTAGGHWLWGFMSGVVLSVGFAAGLGAATLRLRGDYFAIATLGLAEVIRLFILNAHAVTRGPLGIPGIPRPAIGAWELDEPVAFLTMTAMLAALAYVFCELVTRSPLGRALRAIRDDEIAAAALGKDVFRLRVLAARLGAILSAVAGGLWAHYVTYVSPEQFTAEMTFNTWIALLLGGAGRPVGAVVGSGGLLLLLEGSRFLRDVIVVLDEPRMAAMRQALVGLGLIVVPAYMRKRM
jgi:branched-chain amino acid transport system permease protein